MAAEQTEVVTESNRCAEIVSGLLRTETEVAVDAEGVNLGRTGPLTLLQVGTRDGRVYLFDIHKNKVLLQPGFLKDLLESTKIVKIIHSCRGDSAALRAQFEVNLHNVFDTQVAHLEIEESKGKRLPVELKLADLCDMYGGNSAALESKDDIKKAWMTTAGYWAIRPLKPEMIQYAVADVIVLFALYDNLISLLHEKGLYGKFQKSVDVEIVVQTDSAVDKRKQELLTSTVDAILKEIATKCDRREYQCLEDLNENEARAIGLCRTDQIIRSSSTFKKIRMQSVDKFVMETEGKIANDPMACEVSGGLYGKLKANESEYIGTDLGRRIKILLNRVGKIQMEQLKSKYSVDTPLEYIRGSDFGPIRSIRVDEEDNAIRRALYYRVTVRDLLVLKKQYQENPRAVEINKGLHNKIRFLATRSGHCSRELKHLSKELWTTFVQRYGREHKY
ncbi:piRNA biogenesis protein EXD1-like [Liolophura sinensis]|uniref:piRNA biogenesis protein EXD1-like n=1 Tax=Liolophura sinensis TaxID=3198878 RepID=UPI003158913B